MFDTPRKLVRHFWRRWRRGPVVTRSDHNDGGKLIQYRSGYVEYYPKEGGKPIDVELDLYFQARIPRHWQCVAYGGGGSLVLYDLKRDEALQKVSQELGTVMYVDDDGFIFYKPKEWTPTLPAKVITG